MIDDNEEGPLEEDIPEHAMSGDSPSDRVTCPLTSKPYTESTKAYSFAGWPDLPCWKDVFDRAMQPEEYAEALACSESGETPALLEGFKRKDGTSFSALLQLAEDSSRFVLGRPPAVESDHSCPLSGKPVLVYHDYFEFPGYPEVRCWKKKLGRTMTVPDYMEILEADGGEVIFHGFVSKKGKSYDAPLKLDKKENKVVAVFKD